MKSKTSFHEGTATRVTTPEIASFVENRPQIQCKASGEDSISAAVEEEH